LDLQLGRDLGWLEKELRELRSLGALLATLTTSEAIQADAFVTLRRWATDPDRVTELNAAGFTRAFERARSELRGIVPRVTDLLREVLQLRQELLVGEHPYPGQVRDVEELLPANFVRLVPYERLAHLPRYLRAMRARAERWRRLPAKDAERARQVAPYLAAAARRAWDDPVRWLVEEFRVSVYAQELGTAEPVSAVKLDRALAAGAAGEHGERAAPEPPRPRPLLPPPSPAPAAGESSAASPKRAPLKDLNALGNLFRR
jgi:ATP-dependent helicase HrpA